MRLINFMNQQQVEWASIYGIFAEKTIAGWDDCPFSTGDSEFAGPSTVCTVDI